MQNEGIGQDHNHGQAKQWEVFPAKSARGRGNDAKPKNNAPNAIAAGSVEPKGKGAAATVTKRMKDEIRFDGARIAVVTFHPVALKATP